MPVQLATAVLSETVLPSTARVRAQAARHDAAASGDHPAAQYQARGCRRDDDKRYLGEGEHEPV
jgi:hypothetical protein